LSGLKKPVLIFGYGNPGRHDDGLGPELAERVEEFCLSYVDTDANYQLSLEDAEAVTGRKLVLFADATVEQVENFVVRRVIPSCEVTFTSHLITPQFIAALCENVFDSKPEIWIIGIKGYNFDYGEGLTPEAKFNLEKALDFIKLILHQYEGKTMGKQNQKTILIIDDDSDLRASIRIVLEAAGFSVGEAADGEEGLKIAEKIKPDAVIVDLMMETVDAGSRLSTSLKESGYDGPIYLLSSAGDAVRYNIDAKELGLAGIFQKPINHEVLINTLKTKLKVE